MTSGPRSLHALNRTHHANTWICPQLYLDSSKERFQQWWSTFRCSQVSVVLTLWHLRPPCEGTHQTALIQPRPELVRASPLSLHGLSLGQFDQVEEARMKMAMSFVWTFPRRSRNLSHYSMNQAQHFAMSVFFWSAESIGSFPA